MQTSALNKKPRVIRIVDEEVTFKTINKKKYPYVDSIRQLKINKMLELGVKALTDKNCLSEAWKSIIPYRKGDRIAIKPNLNDLFNEFRFYVASPQVINSVVKSLTDVLGVLERDIAVYDLTRFIPSSYRNRIPYNIRFIERGGRSFLRRFWFNNIRGDLAKADQKVPVRMRREILNSEGEAIRCYLPKCVTECDHLINIPIFKSHEFVLMSGALKNHYGTIRFSDCRSDPDCLHYPVIHDCIADINAHSVIKSRTRLIIMDAIFGRISKKQGPPDLQPNSLFIASDPLALDSIISIQIRRHQVGRGDRPSPDTFLELANRKGVGTYEFANSENELRLIEYRTIDAYRGEKPPAHAEYETFASSNESD